MCYQAILGACIGLLPALTIQSTYYTGQVAGLKANININESLGHIHKVVLSNNPTALSLQKESIIWPDAPIDLAGATVAAQKGWWMSFAKTVDLGDVSTAIPLDISAAFPTIAKSLSDELVRNPINIPLLDALGGIVLQTPVYANIGLRDLSLYATPSNPVNVVSLNLSSQKLVQQAVTPNCYGARTFC